MRLHSFTLLLLCFLMSSCASTLRSWKNAITGDDTSQGSRKPASARNELSIDNRSGTNPTPDSDPTGPDLTQNELMAQGGHHSAAAAAGYRRNGNPWRGTEPFNEGSLWNPDSQDGYLFSKNLLHKKGDIIIVNLEAEINDILNEKISQMLGRSSLNQVLADEAGRAARDSVAERAQTITGNSRIANALGNEIGSRATASIEGENRWVDVDSIPVRILGYLPRNTFAVEGMRRVYIKNAAYKLRLAGIIRDEDIGPQNAVSSNFVFESKLEIVK